MRLCIEINLSKEDLGRIGIEDLHGIRRYLEIMYENAAEILNDVHVSKVTLTSDDGKESEEVILGDDRCPYFDTGSWVFPKDWTQEEKDNFLSND